MASKYVSLNELDTDLKTLINNKVDSSNVYSKAETDTKIQDIIGTAPEALNTLQEIATALNNDGNAYGTIQTQISNKVDKITGKGLSTEDYTTAEKSKLASTLVVNQTEKDTWNAKASGTHTHDDRYYTETEVDTKLYNKADSSTLTTHTGNSTIHITSGERTTWNTVTNKVDKVTGKGLSTLDYTQADKDKLDSLSSSATIDYNTMNNNLTTHKTSADHDGRYYTETEIDTKLASKADGTTLTGHTSNSTIHVTQADKDKWDAGGNIDVSSKYDKTGGTITGQVTIDPGVGYATNVLSIRSRNALLTGYGDGSSIFHWGGVGTAFDTPVYINNGLNFQAYGQTLDFNGAMINNTAGLHISSATGHAEVNTDWNGYPTVDGQGFVMKGKNLHSGTNNNWAYQFFDYTDSANPVRKFGVDSDGTVTANSYKRNDGVTLATSTDLASKADSTHTHDTRYYTETEIDTQMASKADATTLTGHTGNTTVHVTQTDKDTWNAKSSFSGSYTDLTNKPTIPTTLASLTADSTHRLVTDTQITSWNSHAHITQGTVAPTGTIAGDYWYQEV